MPSAPGRPGVAIRSLEPGEWQAYRAIRLRALLEAPGAFGSTLEREAALAPETWAARVAKAAVSGIDCPLVAVAEGEFAALAWAKDAAVALYLRNRFEAVGAPYPMREGTLLLEQTMRLRLAR